MRIHPLAAIAALVLAIPLLFSGCDAACDPGHPSILCPSNLSGSSAGVCSSGGDVYALGLDPSWTPHPQGWVNPQPTTAARQLLYGCGQAVCADSAATAAQAFANAIGASSTEGLFVVDLGSTGPQIQAMEPVAAAQWLAAGSPCYNGPTCDPCDDGEGGTLPNVGENCAGTGPSCCAGLTCVGNVDGFTGVCQGTLQPCPQAPPQPNWQGLTTTMLRQIANANNINGCATQTGITQSQNIGLTFEKWVLTAIGAIPDPPKPGRNNTLFLSTERQQKNTLNGHGGLPASVIPEFIGNQTYTVAGVSATFDESIFFEVKAVTGALTPGTSNWQIIGLLDAVNTQITKPAGPHPPPVVYFITTSNTTVSTGVITQATMWNVAVWQQPVLYDANGGSNPNLTLGTATCLNAPSAPALCMASALALAHPGPQVSTLTAPTTPSSSLIVPGDPDPAEID